MANVLNEEKRQQVLALGRLGWTVRRIEETTGVRRETASAYLRAAGVGVRRSGWPRRPPDPKPAIQVSTDSGKVAESKPAIQVITDPMTAPSAVGSGGAWPPPPGRSPQASACEPYREWIALAVSRRRDAFAIYRDLVDDHGFSAGYSSVKRFVRRLRTERAGDPQSHPVIETAPGEEAQVDYGGDGPMVRHPESGKYRRMRLFVMTLGYSRKSVRLLTWRSSSEVWARLHEQSFRRLAGSVHTVVLDYVARHIMKRVLCGVAQPCRKERIELSRGERPGALSLWRLVAERRAHRWPQRPLREGWQGAIEAAGSGWAGPRGRRRRTDGSDRATRTHPASRGPVPVEPRRCLCRGRGPAHGPAAFCSTR